ncbi:pneumococcal histidine triad protein E precursor, truncation [Streptococcus pneumoniae]|nr:ATPase [Streptococcus pneumoniae]KNB75182.1 ATPase [Streptococcus pneumoniae 13856]KGI33106.1 Histidine triad protein [Streptococcus pneumoniae]KXV88022.1 ATPase [Streptococcus pneumoniae]KXW07082.1 ATPase [Streptococcus pneumoniae]
MTPNNGVSAVDDGYVFNPNDIVRDTGDAYIVRHGDHYHYIPKSSLNNPPSHSNTEEVGSSSSSVLSNPSLHVHHEEEDGHGFDANRIISEDSEGFVIPHGDHNHYIKVQTKGYEAALKNKIPSLQSNYQPGTFDEKAVLAKVDQLLADSRSIYKDKPIEQRQIELALGQFTESLKKIKVS